MEYLSLLKSTPLYKYTHHYTNLVRTAYFEKVWDACMNRSITENFHLKKNSLPALCHLLFRLQVEPPTVKQLVLY